jgi:isocitrate dehydrogenase kinase/phosphatase
LTRGKRGTTRAVCAHNSQRLRILLRRVPEHYARARSRFENADWLGIHASTIERIDLYKVKLVGAGFVELVAGSELRNYSSGAMRRKIYAG